MQVKKNDNGSYVIHILPNEEIIEELKKFAKCEELDGASIQGIGTTSKVVLGYFDEQIMGYNTMEMIEPMEMINVLGSISKNGDDYVVHLHGTFGDDEFKVWGGHVMSATIFATGEFFVYPADKIDRKLNPTFNLSLFNLD